MVYVINHFELLLSYVQEDRKEEFSAYIENLVANDDCYGIDYSFLGFMEDYVCYAELCKRKADVMEGVNLLPGSRYDGKRRVTVYDVGCATALQHVLFDPRIRYVGISNGRKRPEFFRDDCSFVQGRFADVVESLEIDEDAIGIANMSLLYGSPQEELDLFDRSFKRKFIL